MVELLNSHSGLLTRLINFGVVLESKRAKLCHRFNIISLSNFFCVRSEVVKRLWAYLKKENLQDPENKQFFTPDKLMEPVFGKEKIKAFGMAKYLKEHLN